MQNMQNADKTTNRPQYITQLNAFHRWLATHHLPTNARLLWFMLIGLCNTGGWEEWLQIDNVMLMHLVGAANEKTAMRARQDLIDAGLLVYEKGRKTRPGRYRLVWFEQNDSKIDSKYDRKNDSKTDSSMTGNTTDEHTSDKRTDKEKDEMRQSQPRVPAALSEVWRAYADMRKKMRKPLTGSASALVLQTLGQLAPDRPDEQKAILEQSILNGWAGVYPLKKEETPEVPPASYDVEAFERELLYGKIEYRKRGDT